MTRKTEEGGDLTWVEAIRDIPEAGLSRQREASADELAHIARALDLAACTRLAATYAIKPTLDGRCRLSGTLRAEIAQTCVVTLEPVDSSITESFEAMFWPEQSIPAPRGGEVDIDEEADPEPIVAGQIAVGRVVFECLAAAMDPFPRKPGAVLEQDTAPAAKSSSAPLEGPFAVLSSIRPKG